MRVGKVFRESFKYLGKVKAYIYLAAGLFLVGAIIGFFSSSQLGFLDELLKNLAKQAEGLNTSELIWFIFQNNLKSAFFTMIFGVFFGIFPVINALTNGVLLGYVFSRVSAIDGWVSLWKIFPHGIFELPAVFIAMGLGIKLGAFIFSRKKIKELKTRFYGSLAVFLIIVLPLLIIAAIIEGLLIIFYK